MIKNYFIVALRNFSRNKIFVLINTLGLGLALACCIIGYLNYKFAAGFNQMHKNKEHIFKIGVTKKIQDEQVKYGITPVTLGPAIEAEMDEVAGEVIRYTRTTDAIKYGDKILNKDIAFADPRFFEVFTYPLLSGTDILNDPGTIIITRRMAIAYFGDDDPLGKRLNLITPEGKQFGFTVSGVIEDIPLNNSMQFDAIVSYQNFLDIRGYDEMDWKHWQAATFLYLEDTDLIDRVEKMLQKYAAPQNTSRPDWPISSFYTTSLSDMAKGGRNIRAFWLWPAPVAAATYTPAILAVLILLIACFNFTNTSLMMMGKRLKEIGVRKALGGTRAQLAIQFIIESALLSAIAVLISLAVANYLVPAYNSLWQDMSIEMNLMEDISLLIFIGIMLLVTTGLSGVYPALYVSRLKPVKIIKGPFRYGRISRFSKVLLMLQFGFSLMALLAAVGFLQNATYQEQLGLGYDEKSVIGIPVRNDNQAQVFINTIRHNPDIEIVSNTADHVGRNDWSMVVKGKDEKELEVHVFDVGLHYLEAMNINLNSGRYFTAENEITDRETSVVINQMLADEFGWEEPLGKIVNYHDTIQKKIIGVVDNFNTYGYFIPRQPTMFRLIPDEQTNLVIVKAKSSNLLDVNRFLVEQWLKVNPTSPYEGFYQEQQVAASLEVNQNIVLVLGFLATVALLMSSIGLFTMVSLSILRRTKELGIRKVLGASTANLVKTINLQYLLILLLASIFGAMGGYFLTQALMSGIYADHVQLNWISITVPIILMLLIAFTTISGKVFKAATRNPVKSLRYE